MHEPLFERDVIFFNRRRADVATGRQNLVVLLDFLERCRFAKAGNIFVYACMLLPLATRGRLRLSWLCLRRKIPARAVHHLAELASIDEQYLTAAVAELVVLLVARQEPQAGGNLR